MKWSPDTCNCSFEVEIIADNLVCKAVLNSCPSHNTGTKQEKFDSCHTDNKYKNKCVAQVCEDHELEASEISWNYDQDMKLSLAHPSLTKTKINNSISKVVK